jgi:hypothetical protein
VISASFIFTEGELDAAFHRLDALIEAAARETEGFLGKESWLSPDGAKRNAMYYWRDRAALRGRRQWGRHRTEDPGGPGSARYRKPICSKSRRNEMQWGEETLTLETGKVARQADGSVIATLGETTSWPT